MFRHIITMVLALVIGISLSASVSGDPWYYESFDELDDGSLTPQDGWRNGANASGEIQDDIFHGTDGQSLYIIENSGNYRTFDAGHTGLQYLAFWAYVPNEYPEGNLQIYTGASDGDNHIAFFSRIYNDRRIAAHNGDTNGNVVNTINSAVTYSYGEWFHVRYVMDFDDQSYSLYINDEPGAEDVTFRGGAKEMSWLQMRWDHDETLEIYIDEVELGDGLGEDALNLQEVQKAVSHEGKLSIAWGDLKRL